MRRLKITSIFFLLISVPILAKGKSIEKSNHFTNFIEDLSTAKSINDLKEFMHPEAYVSFSSKYESYFHIISDEILYKLLEREFFKKVQVIKSRTNEDATDAFIYLLAKGENKDVGHTFYVKLSDSGKWQILHWHAG